MRRIEESMPELGKGMVMVKTGASLVSPGSEFGGGWIALRQMQIHPEERPPKPFGYSSGGTVVTLGEGVDRFKQGDRVCCIGARYAQHADYSVVPQNMVFPIPESMTFAQASYAMLLGTGLQALRRGKPEMGEYVAVVGLGLVGLLTARLAELAGCRVIGWDTSPERLAYAAKLGIEATVQVGKEDPVDKTMEFTGGHGLDHGVIALGGDASRPYDSLMECMKVSPDGHAYGNITIVGGADFHYKKNLSNVNIVRSSRTGPGYHDKAWERGASYPPVFVRWDTGRNIEYCLELVSNGRINVDALTTHTIPFEKVEEQTTEATLNPETILGMVFEMDN